VDSLIGLLGFAFVSTVTPGPNNVLLWASGSAFGLRRTLPHIVGTAAGIGLMALAVAAGLGALVTAVPQIALAMKIAGSVYLLYLAVQVAGMRGLTPTAIARPLGFVAAVAFQLINPKAWIFAVGAMTTFRRRMSPSSLGACSSRQRWRPWSSRRRPCGQRRAAR
jgi:threonine/homoserine/homoserine lactone efflux protein